MVFVDRNGWRGNPAPEPSLFVLIENEDYILIRAEKWATRLTLQQFQNALLKVSKHVFLDLLCIVWGVIVQSILWSVFKDGHFRGSWTIRMSSVFCVSLLISCRRYKLSRIVCTCAISFSSVSRIYAISLLLSGEPLVLLPPDKF